MSKEQEENPKDRIGVTKPQLHLIPASAEIIESQVMTLGAKKYGPFNWRSTKVRASVYVSAAKRHLAQWFDGEDDDKESGVSHLAHIRACMGILLDAQSLDCMADDRPSSGTATKLIGQYTEKTDSTQSQSNSGEDTHDQ